MVRLVLLFVISGFVGTAQADDGACDQKTASGVEQILVAAGNTCLSTSDCLPGENCIRGVCQFGGAGSCLTDVDCALGERCVAGMCRR